MNCYMCGAPPCPNGQDNDGAGNWDSFDGLVVPNEQHVATLRQALQLLRRVAVGEFIADDPDEQCRFSTKLQAEALRLASQMAEALEEGGAA